MKRFKIIGLLIFTVTILFTTIITGCTNAEKAIIGKWSSGSDVSVKMAYDFKANNEVDVFMSDDLGGDLGLVEELIYSGKYTLIDNKVELTLSGNTSAVYFNRYITEYEKGTFEYKIKGDTLMLSPDGIEERLFKKVN